MYYVYILKSLKDGKIYTGLANNLDKRIEQHQKGQVKSTKYRRSLELVYFEAYREKKDALRREKYLKGGGKAKNDLKRQIKESLGSIK